ncbi:MAG TPA: DUF1566 domain-containing protein [Candidatus Binatia bacterium]
MSVKCPGDLNADNKVTIDEILASVNSALNGCLPISPRFVDNNNGTISDTKTGLVWEKKSNDGSIHDKDNRYTWSQQDSEQWGYWDGTVFTEFLATLNREAFAGHSDWDLPSLEQLQTLLDRDSAFPAMDQHAFNPSTCTEGCNVTSCSCTAESLAPPDSFYWSLSGLTTDMWDAWVVDFTEGTVRYEYKASGGYARAVRGGFYVSPSTVPTSDRAPVR